MQKVKTMVLALTLITLGLSAISVVQVSAASPLREARITADFKSDAQNGLNQVGGNGRSVDAVIQDVVNLLTIVVGAAAIIMLLVSGFKYITSSGDSAKVSSAKTTLIYALIGIAVAGATQGLVHLVLSTSAAHTGS